MNAEKILIALYDLWAKEHGEQIEISVKKKPQQAQRTLEVAKAKKPSSILLLKEQKSKSG